MSDLPVKKLIYNVLMENKNGFLTIEEIAELCYPDAFVKATKKHLIGLVKRNMTHSIAMLTLDGYVVIKDLEPCVNGDKLTHKTVRGYKIADSEDITFVKRNLQSKNERLAIANENKLLFEGNAVDKGLLTE